MVMKLKSIIVSISLAISPVILIADEVQDAKNYYDICSSEYENGSWGDSTGVRQYIRSNDSCMLFLQNEKIIGLLEKIANQSGFSQSGQNQQVSNNAY